MVEVIGDFYAPKSLILKVNSTVSLTNLGSHTLQMLLLKSDAIIDPYTISTFTGDITAYEQDYSGYSRETLSGITRVNSIQDSYVWTANDVTFEALSASLQYGLIIDSSSKNIIAIMDLGDVLTFAGDITFDLNVHGFLGIKV